MCILFNGYNIECPPAPEYPFATVLTFQCPFIGDGGGSGGTVDQYSSSRLLSKITNHPCIDNTIIDSIWFKDIVPANQK